MKDERLKPPFAVAANRDTHRPPVSGCLVCFVGHCELDDVPGGRPFLRTARILSTRNRRPPDRTCPQET
jgi:hypothetical protein